MRRTLAAASATLAAVSLTLSSGLTHAAAATPQHSQALAALRYLYSQQNADGSIAGAAGPTEDTIIGTADNGFDPHTLSKTPAGPSALDYLRAQTALGATDGTAGATAKLILALLAAHENPSTFSPTVDLFDKLSGYRQPNGAFANPALGADKKPVEQANTFTQSLAVLAYVAAKHGLPGHAADWLVCAQLTDGGFGYIIHATATAPPTACGDSGSDSNDAAIALQALNAAGISTANSKATTYLRGIQNQDGGFPSYADDAGAPVASDPDSDAVVVQALVARDVDPLLVDEHGHNPVGNLESFQAGDSGGFTYPGKPAPDAFTTSQVPAALALAPYATPTSFVSGSSPLTAASPGSPGPSGSPMPTSGPPLGSAIAVPSTGSGSGGPGRVGLLVAGVLLLVLAKPASRRRRQARS